MAHGGKISRQDAINWVRKYKNKHADSTHSILYDASIFQEILNVPGCVSVRAHFAENDNGKNCLVFVAVDKHGNAISSSTAVASAPDFVWDDGLPCPPVCPPGDL